MTEPTSPTSEATAPSRRAPVEVGGTPARPTPRRTANRWRTAGFTLIELTLALLIIGLLASLGLPRVLPGAGNGSLIRAETYRLAALLRADRNAALTGGAAVVTRIDTDRGVVRSGHGGDLVVMARGTALSLTGPRAGEIRFEADGRSSGGRLVVAAAGGDRRDRGRIAYTILVEPLTAGVVVATGAPR